MTDDNLNGANLSVLECRAVVELGELYEDEFNARTDNEYRKALAAALTKASRGAAKELPAETRERTLPDGYNRMLNDR